MSMEPNSDTTKILQLKPAIKITVDNIVYDRFPVQSRLIGFSENLESVITENIKPYFEEGDWVALSEKLVSVCQNRVRHISTVKVSPLAKLIKIGIKKHKNMTAWSKPEKIQIAIEEAGVWRIIPAMILGFIGKIFGIRGIFWSIAGNRVAEIDGFIPEGMYPYTEWAVLPVLDPQGVCDEIQKNLGIPVVIADANYINVKVLGVSSNIGLDFKTVRKILLDNPLGQGSKMTPFVIVRKVK